MGGVSTKHVTIPSEQKPNWTCEIGNEVFEYPAGTEQDVPDEVAGIIDNINAMKPKEEEIDETSGCTIVRFELDYDGVSASITSNMTPMEVRDAMLKGNVIGVLHNSITDISVPLGTAYMNASIGYLPCFAPTGVDEDGAIEYILYSENANSWGLNAD